MEGSFGSLSCFMLVYFQRKGNECKGCRECMIFQKPPMRKLKNEDIEFPQKGSYPTSPTWFILEFQRKG